MTKAQFMETLLARLGQRQDDSALEAQLQAEVELCQKQLEEASWATWLLAQEQEIPVAAQEPWVTVVALFGWPRERAFWREADGTKTALERVPLEDIITAESADPAVPQFYAIGKDAIHLYPVPVADGTLHFWGLVPQTPWASLRADETNVWLDRAAEYMLGEVGARAAAFYTRDAELALVFAEMRKIAKERLFTQMIAAEQADRLLSFGGDD